MEYESVTDIDDEDIEKANVKAEELTNEIGDKLADSEVDKGAVIFAMWINFIYLLADFGWTREDLFNEIENHMDSYEENQPDVMPVYFDLEGVNWVHTDIDDICEFRNDTGNPGEWDQNVHRVYFENKDGETLYLVYKSKDADEYTESKDENCNAYFWGQVYHQLALKLQNKDIILNSDLTKDLKEFFYSGFKVTLSTPDVGLQRHKNGEYSWSS